MQTGLIKGDFCQNTFPKHLQHTPDSRKFSVSLRLAQGSIRCGIILENLSYFTSEPACTQFGSLMLTVLFCRVQNHLPHTLQNQASTSRETGISGNIFLTAEMSFPDGNKPALSSSCSAMKTGAALTDGSSLRLNGKIFLTFTRRSEFPCPVQTPFWRNHPRQYVPESHPCSSCPPESSAAHAHHGEP